jgi:hypothetical protein
MIHGDERHPSSRAEAVRQRYGEDFFVRIGRHSSEVRRRIKEGDAEAVAQVRRRRAARQQRRPLWRQVLAARHAVALLRNELASRGLSHLDASYALLDGRLHYTADVRQELAQAEMRLAYLEGEHRRVLRELNGER